MPLLVPGCFTDTKRVLHLWQAIHSPRNRVPFLRMMNGSSSFTA